VVQPERTGAFQRAATIRSCNRAAAWGAGSAVAVPSRAGRRARRGRRRGKPRVRARREQQITGKKGARRDIWESALDSEQGRSRQLKQFRDWGDPWLRRCFAGVPDAVARHLQHVLAVERFILEHFFGFGPVLRREQDRRRVVIAHGAGGNDLSGFHQPQHIAEMLLGEFRLVRRIHTELRQDQCPFGASHARRNPLALREGNNADQHQDCSHVPNYTVESSEFQQIQSSDNQIIFGRRGTGKKRALAALLPAIALRT